MGTLTGQQINNTYDGLLKLSDSTTGITTSLQAIEDGLGNNTGLRIATNILEGKGIPTMIPLKGQYYGAGFTATAPVQYGSGVQNTILATQFYDLGQYQYSAITINVVSATTSSDTLEMAIYTSQMINPFGLYPHTPIISGMTASTTTTGQKTYVFPSNISMSGYGAGVYWLVWKISNSGVTPTFRPGANGITVAVNGLGNFIYGFPQQITSNTYAAQISRFNNAGGSIQQFTGTTTFDNPYSSTLNTTQSNATSLAGPAMGFILHTV